jgi:membrane fusion protein, heavy metal efflux system
VSLFQTRAALLFCAACSAAAESPPTFTPPPATANPDKTVLVAPKSRPYIGTKKIDFETDAPVVRAPARIAFRDGAVSQMNLAVPGRVTTVHVKIGDRVKVGDPLITLVSAEAASARALFAVAQADHDAAQKEVTRQEGMAKAGVGIETERVLAQAKLRQIEVELVRARTTTGMLGGGGGPTIVLRAPIDGTVIARRASVGTVAQPGGESLIDIGNPTALWVVADVFERDLSQVHEGAEVDIALSTEDKPRRGHVVTVGSTLTGSLRTAPIYISLDDGNEHIRAGMFARATIKAPAGRSIVIPAEAVLIKTGKKYVVYVEQPTGRFAPREVVVGRSVDGRVQVLSGLRPGENIVVKGALLLDTSAEQLM